VHRLPPFKLAQVTVTQGQELLCFSPPPCVVRHATWTVRHAALRFVKQKKSERDKRSLTMALERCRLPSRFRAVIPEK